MSTDINVQCINGMELLKSIPDKSINLILTDPPYVVSRESGMNKHYNKVKENEEKNIKYVKTEEEWQQFKQEKSIVDDDNKDNYFLEPVGRFSDILEDEPAIHLLWNEI